MPLENLYADPENDCYTKLGLAQGLDTLMRIETPLALGGRALRGELGDLKDVLGRWSNGFGGKGFETLIPPKKDTQGYIQGGSFVFEGDTLLFEHRDASPGDHALLDDLRAAAGLALAPRA
mmetsp:Transcript_30704/g.71748  ORF Transcript_30704/g.71748 Transcript_30704/m.71748 type:complete len:121 (+) Transcript_30704:549-911(+)